MTKMQKRIVMYMAAILILLALVCTCLVGNTFARFVTSGTGKAQTTVAKYVVDGGNTGVYGSSTLEFGKLSPDEGGYDAKTTRTSDSHEVTTNDSAPYKVAVIEVSSTDVDIDLTITLSDLAGYTDSSYGDTYKITTAGTYTSANKAVLAGDIDNVFSITAYYIVEDSEQTLNGTTAENLNTLKTGGNWTQVTSGSKVESVVSSGVSSKYITVYAFVTWTTDYTTYGDNGNGGYLADDLDTLIGETVYGVQCTLTVQAVQGSEQPA